MNHFRDKIINQISVWAWAATVLPIVTLAAIFLFYMLGWDSAQLVILIVGAVAMFFAAVIWWWWVIHTIAKVTDSLGKSADDFQEVKEEIKGIKTDIKNLKDI